MVDLERYTVIDIETMQNPDMIDCLPNPVVKYGNLKDPAKRAVKEMDAKEKQIEKMAVNPLFGKIACCGYKRKDDFGVLFGDSEKELVEKIVNRFFTPNEEDMNPIIVTHNGFKFDVPFIYKRALALGVKVSYPLSYYTKRYDISTHIDTRLIWNGWDMSTAAMTDKNTSLDVLGKALLGYGKVEFDVSTIPELMKTEDGRSQLADYCMMDVQITDKLLNMFDGFLI
jgi:DNA polymerase elongation subunit (family B)